MHGKGNYYRIRIDGYRNIAELIKPTFILLVIASRGNVDKKVLLQFLLTHQFVAINTAFDNFDSLQKQDKSCLLYTSRCV